MPEIKVLSVYDCYLKLTLNPGLVDIEKPFHYLSSFLVEIIQILCGTRGLYHKTNYCGNLP